MHFASGQLELGNGMFLLDILKAQEDEGLIVLLTDAAQRARRGPARAQPRAARTALPGANDSRHRIGQARTTQESSHTAS